jgi:hypothetical protein
MPADSKLERPFTAFFDRAFSLYTSFVGGAGVLKEPGLKRVPSLPLISDEPGDAALKTCELYALTSFGLNPTSQNLTTGDAYAVLKASGAPKQLTDFHVQTAEKLFAFRVLLRKHVPMFQEYAQQVATS